MGMTFIVAPMPPVDIANDPDQEHPASRFIDLGLPGFETAWVYDGKHFAVAFDTRDPELALAELPATDDVTPTLDSLNASVSAAYGDMLFQERENETIHAEYGPRWLRGRELDFTAWLEPDGELETRIREWIATTEDALITAIRARSVEIR
jgi:hypothetical protein